jgi:hypothetical protein
MFEWFAQTLRTYPEIAIFLALGIGYYVGKFTFRGIGLGAVTSTLLAGVLIGQVGITISGPVRPRHRQRRRAAGAVRSGRLRVVPRRADRRREAGGL